MEKTSEIRRNLQMFSGTQHWYEHGVFPNVLYTDGVKYLAESAECHWLVDAIASHQVRCQQDDMLRGMQFWELFTEQGGWVLACYRDKGDEAFRQEIPYSDFPLDDGIRIWVAPIDWERVALYLPSEH